MLPLSFIFTSIIGVPTIPHLTVPTPSQINVNEHPSFSWDDIPEAESVSTYDLVVGTDPTCASSTYILHTTVGVKSTSLPDGVNLQQSTVFYACVQANGPGGSSGYSTPVQFTTRSSTISSPIISTSARSLLQAPSGQKQILISGTNGEQNATAKIYLKSSPTDIEVGSTIVDNNSAGNFSVSVDVTLISSTAGPRTYYAILQRAGTTNTSSPSNLITFYYDPKFALPTPELVLDGGATGALKWKPVASVLTTNYRVYRRVGNESCTNSNTTVCYLNKPFTRIALLPTPSGDGLGFIHYLDNSIGTVSPGDGVSYFIVAASASCDQNPAPNTSCDLSDRSNALSFKDINPPLRHAEIIQVNAQNTGQSIQVFYCNIATGGFLDTDNSPDLTAQVQYFQRPDGQGCPSNKTDYDTNSLTPTGGRVNMPFDSLVTFSDVNSNIENCVLAGEISDLNPNTPYCFQICQQDALGHTEVNCNTLDQRTAIDIVPPIFSGLSSAAPLSDGTSVQLNWNLATEDQTTRLIIQYQLQTTNQFDATGLPVFKDILNDPGVTVVKGGVNSATISNLQTGSKYCFQASAIDNALPNANRNTPANSYQCATTLDNRPYAQNISIIQGVNNEPYKLSIQFQVIDRLAGNSGLEVSLDTVAYRLSGGDWKTIQPEHLEGSLAILQASTSINSAPVNKIIFNTLPYFSGEQNIEFQIQLKESIRTADLGGNAITQVDTSQSQSSPQTIFAGMATISSFGDRNLSGCELQMNSGATSNFWMMISLLFFAAIALLSVRKIKAEGSRANRRENQLFKTPRPR